MQITQLIASFQQQLGIMTWPLLIMSVITLLILIERALFLMIRNRTDTRTLLRKLYRLDINSMDDITKFTEAISNRKSTLYQGVVVLFSHRQLEKSLREETVNVWLAQQKKQYTSGLKLLAIIGAVSPLIGLLGTVLGLIAMFKDLAHTTGSIAPADLADGLGLAMSTTAAGLLIALPAISGSQLLRLWADEIIRKIEHTLNYCNLYLEGIDLADSSPSSQALNTAQAEWEPIKPVTPQ